MESFIAVLPWGTLGPSALLAVGVFMVLTGKGIRTEREWLDMKTQRDEFRQAAEAERAARDTIAATVLTISDEKDIAAADTRLALKLLGELHDRVFSK